MMMYCHIHNRHWDTDNWENCPECISEEIEEGLGEWIPEAPVEDPRGSAPDMPQNHPGKPTDGDREGPRYLPSSEDFKALLENPRRLFGGLVGLYVLTQVIPGILGGLAFAVWLGVSGGSL